MAIAKSISRYEPDDKIGDFKLTDVGNAERYVAMFKEDVKYCPAYKKWYL